jgi:hypothetical protein
MEDLAVYGFVTPMKLRIVIALALSDVVVRDADVVLVCHPTVILSLVSYAVILAKFYNRSSKLSIWHTAAPLPTHS